MYVPAKGKERTRGFQWRFFVVKLGKPSIKFLVHKLKIYCVID